MASRPYKDHVFWDYSHPQYNVSLDKLNSILHRNSVNSLKKSNFLNNFLYLCSRRLRKATGRRPAVGNDCSRSAIDASIIALAQPQFWPPEISHKYVFIMARPIRETPVLKGEDAFNFEMRRLEVEHMSKEQRAENRRKLEERIANAKNKIEWCW